MKYIKLMEEIHPNWAPETKWDVLEKEVSDAILPIIEKHKKDFGNDSYAVIDAVQQIFDGMFQKKNK